MRNMKKRFLFVLIVLNPLIVFGQTSSRVETSILDGKLVINKTEISRDWKLTTVTKALGNADRFTDGTNRVYMYDKHGAVAYEMKKNGKLTGTVGELGIYFSIKQSNVLVPYNAYVGSFSIEGVNVTKATKWEDISQALKSKGYKKRGDYQYAKNGTYLIFRFLDNGQLETLSLGKG
jgi:hypothetical protein